jgi:hypothetical protein
MKFEIERTSFWYKDEMKEPCEGAVLMKAGTSTTDPVYTIDIESVEDLVELMKREGEIIIKASYKDGGLPVIEIYDTYRE